MFAMFHVLGLAALYPEPQRVDEADLSSDVFERLIVRGGVPVIIRLSHSHSHSDVAALLYDIGRRGPPTFRDGSDEMLTLPEITRALLENRSVYVFGYKSDPESTHRYRMEALPTAFTRLGLPARMMDDGQFFVAGGRVENVPHYDPELNGNLHAVLHGRKLFTLWPSDQLGANRWPLTTHAPVSLGGALASRETLEALLPESSGYMAWVHAGEVLYMPPRTWHLVQYEGPCVAFGVSFYRSRVHWAAGLVGMLWYLGFEPCLGLVRSRWYESYRRVHLLLIRRWRGAAAAAALPRGFELFIWYLMLPLVVVTPVVLYLLLDAGSGVAKNPSQYDLRLPVVQHSGGEVPLPLALALIVSASVQLSWPVVLLLRVRRSAQWRSHRLALLRQLRSRTKED